jgi:hypothetical protein
MPGMNLRPAWLADPSVTSSPRVPRVTRRSPGRGLPEHHPAMAKRPVSRRLIPGMALPLVAFQRIYGDYRSDGSNPCTELTVGVGNVTFPVV